jgi:hypothetical protein
VDLGGLPVESDVSVGEWIHRAIRGRTGVAGIVPAVFEAYARVFHSAVRYAGDVDLDVPWAEVTVANGTVAHPRMQWPAVTGSWAFMHADSQPPVWDDAPAEGHLPTSLAAAVSEVLARHTTTPEDCLFGRWDGFGFDSAALDGVPRLRLPGAHDVVLVRGRVRDAVRNLAPEPNEQSANLWWPADRTWLVATDIDLMTTYVGGSRDCIDELLAVPVLEVAPATPEDSLTFADDPINPTPPQR